MRQAGRSLPEYRALRGDGSILDAIHDAELAAEITLQPVRRYGVDAAIPGLDTAEADRLISLDGARWRTP